MKKWVFALILALTVVVTVGLTSVAVMAYGHGGGIYNSHYAGDGHARHGVELHH